MWDCVRASMPSKILNGFLVELDRCLIQRLHTAAAWIAADVH